MCAAFPEFYLSDQSTLVSATISESLNAGASTSATTFWLYNDKGGSRSSSVLKGAQIVAQVLDDGDWVTLGHPAVDEAWMQVKVTGLDNTGDSTMETQTCEFIPLGANRVLILKDIPDNCGRSIQAKIVVPANASNAASELRLVLFYDDTMVVLARYVGLASGANGVLLGHLDRTNRRLTGGFALSASGTAVVTQAYGWYVFDGYPRFKVAEGVTLNQTAADGALGAGQSYKATLSLADNASTITVTKSNKGAAPTAPAVPANQILIGRVTVAYQGSGTSIINSGDLDTAAVVFGEYWTVAATGLNVRIGVGETLTLADTNAVNTTTTALAVGPGDGPNFIWVLPDGTFTKNTSYARPQNGAILISVVSVAGGVIADIFNAGYREYVGRPVQTHAMTLQYWGPLGSVALTDVANDRVPFDAVLVGYLLWLGTAGAGAGAITLDFNSDGTTVFTSQATKDYRPSFTDGMLSIDAHEEGRNEVRVLARGAKVSMDIDVASLAGAEDLTVMLFFRPFQVP